jgi:hypothetical protein
METFSISNVSIKFSISMCFVETTNMPSSTNARNRYFGAFVYFLKYLLLAEIQTLQAYQNMV